MAINVQIFGAAGEVTGSCHLVTVGDQRLLLEGKALVRRTGLEM